MIIKQHIRSLITFLSISLSALPAFSQTNTEVFLGDLSISESGISVTNLENITNNPGYDNQPSFLVDGGAILLASTRENQTDVALYDIENKKLNYLNSTPSFSEYSPVQTPNKIYISFIILGEDGTQQFWQITPSKRDPEILESEDVIGYYAWYDQNSYLCFVLATEDSPSTLQFHNHSTGEKKILGENPGRSIHKIPGTNALSFIDKNESPWMIKSYTPENGEIKEITNTLEEVEDMAWTPDGAIIMGKGNTLNVWTEDNNWSDPVQIFDSEGTISRLAVSPDGTQIAIVFEEN